MTLRPAPPDTRHRVPPHRPRPAGRHPRRRRQRRRHPLGTTLVKGDVRVSTVEHLLSAFAGLGIDNAHVEVSAPEVPIMDGSAGPFVFLLQSAGIEEQRSAEALRAHQARVRVEDGDKWARFDPFDGFKVELRDRVRSPDLQAPRRRRRRWISPRPRFSRKSAARAPSASCATSRRCARTTSRSAAISTTPSCSTISACSTRTACATRTSSCKHKILDAIGDLYLLGHSLIGEFSGYKSGHALNNQLLRTLLADTLDLGRGGVREARRRADRLRAAAAGAGGIGHLRACREERRRARGNRLPQPL